VTKFYEMEDTICALATPAGTGALALVRLSGPRAYEIATTALEITLPPRGRLRGRHFVRRIGLGAGMSVEAVVICFLAPHSYTGEDTLELSLPGNLLLVERVLARLRDAGARPAEPGEFTYRAYLNGRLDLVQAEAVNDAIRAGSEAALRLTLHELAGEGSARVEQWLAQLNGMLARIEVVHDYPGDVEDTPAAEIDRELLALADELAEHLEFYRNHHRLRRGMKVVILGPPNVGKSTLFNHLLGYERALVSTEPGTTRDYIEEPLEMGGIRLALVDTAGLRPARELVEMMGVERAQELLGEADALILLEEVFHVQPDRPLPLPRLASMQRRATEAGIPFLVVLNKPDTVAEDAERERLRRLASDLGGVATDARRGAGVDGVRTFLRSLVAVHDTGVRFLLTERQSALVEKALAAVAEARAALAAGLALDAVCIDLYDAQRALAQILATETREVVLSEIFSRFCLGK